jgi:hypothetical protein
VEICDRRIIIQLSHELMAALEHVEGHGIVLVIGAGSSVDDPTGLELGGHYSQLAHDALRRRGVIAEQPHPWDLAELADAVIAATGNQDQLVAELPIQAMRLATPNRGHVLAAALQSDGFIRSILTLNYDTAMASAIAQLGSADVHVIERKEDMPPTRPKLLIYLHGSASGRTEDLVLTTADLDSSWQGSWKELITNQTMLAPVVAFVGLGSSATLLSSTLQKMKDGIGTAAAFLLVGPGDQSTTTFAQSVGADAAHCLDCGWSAFMQECAAYALETLVGLSSAKFPEVERQKNVPVVDTAAVVESIRQMDYMSYGAARAKWFGVENRRRYMPHPAQDATELIHLADVIHFIAEIESWVSTTATFADGDVEVRGARITLLSSLEPADFETAVTKIRARIADVAPGMRPSIAVIARTNPPENVAAPANIVHGGHEGVTDGQTGDIDIIRSHADAAMFFLPDVRSNPSSLIGAIL